MKHNGVDLEEMTPKNWDGKTREICAEIPNKEHRVKIKPNNEEITRHVKEMNIAEVTDMFYRYIQEGENLNGDFTKAEDFISKLEHIRDLIFKKDNWYWNNEIKIYKIILEKYKKI